ncbi:MAG: hypothetical protein II479_04535, partial [Bacteroidales bacterium]|nr:hypothetical protein [Bacteroidales bacterium]
MKHGFLLGAALFLAVAAGAQERSWEYWKNADEYLSDQAEVLLDYVDATLQAYPPSAKPGEAR